MFGITQGLGNSTVLDGFIYQDDGEEAGDPIKVQLILGSVPPFWNVSEGSVLYKILYAIGLSDNSIGGE